MAFLIHSENSIYQINVISHWNMRMFNFQESIRVNALNYHFSNNTTFSQIKQTKFIFIFIFRIFHTNFNFQKFYFWTWVSTQWAILSSNFSDNSWNSTSWIQMHNNSHKYTLSLYETYIYREFYYKFSGYHNHTKIWDVTRNGCGSLKKKFHQGLSIS